MDVSGDLGAGVDVALNEGEVLGVRLDASGRWCDLLVHVLALPAVGPLDPDGRRVLRLTAPTRLTVMLRTDRTATAGYGPPLALANIEAVEDFFASLDWSGSMYGWRFLDDPTLTRDWPDQSSLSIEVGDGPGSHCLYWFNECGRDGTAYCVEGMVTFEGIDVLRADGTPIALAEFVADGRRQWSAFYDGDPRLSVEAQRAATNGTPSWRPLLRRPTPPARD